MIVYFVIICSATRYFFDYLKMKQVEEKEQKQDLSSQESDDAEMDYNNSELVKCRYYRNKMPAKDDVVAVVTTEIKDLGAYVRLIEYDNIEGFIMLS